MKRAIALLIILISFSSCQEQQKIGFIDRTKAINEYQAKKDIEDKYKPKNDAYIKRRDSLVKQFEFDYQNAAVKAQRMSPKKQQELAQEFQQRDALLRQQIQFEKEELEKEFTTEIDSAMSKFKTFVKNYGKTNGYTFILGTSDLTNSVMYGSETTDITDAVIKALNEDYKK
ncbi:OmpH family outer membrane protein [Winogradskyella algicola]|jgi:outer membrane protein|uniref:OmpH family outer membrane protein n=1 Tax=Winogradskyella algicola TaxID=2575815 RepID=UPI001107FEB3|nr:OmpH family outer membrane protein [Winogradskyella algicola]